MIHACSKSFATHATLSTTEHAESSLPEGVSLELNPPAANTRTAKSSVMLLTGGSGGGAGRGGVVMSA